MILLKKKNPALISISSPLIPKRKMMKKRRKDFLFQTSQKIKKKNKIQHKNKVWRKKRKRKKIMEKRIQINLL